MLHCFCLAQGSLMWQGSWRTACKWMWPKPSERSFATWGSRCVRLRLTGVETGGGERTVDGFAGALALQPHFDGVEGVAGQGN